MKMLALACLFASSLALTGCGSGEPAVIGQNDPEGIASYEAIIAEQQMTQRSMEDAEKEVMSK
ncbi:YgdI/YgdR family lipoprotein [Aporhodopirellula aestuarii]|uniref:YgdI/YgdR family lipoprotein n=1 Tax=Aporhodopirellula aestuarii TaxID=2950107 RepID=A0ABT0U029_9BACT|nr:YgdI/YgdR family lipoprotein [Aporhodopirellula aestuarii]MCM2369984.1 YgdI/YgdR family lipoprotein [Aporhodopirellula aestuarii]